MSLSQNKSALFGKEPLSSSSNTVPKIVSKTASAPIAKINTGISPATIKAKKIEEAKEWNDKAIKHIKTSVFQWSADYLAAAPCYESSSNAYKAAGELEQARKMMVSSAEANEKAGCLTASALCFIKASDLAKSMNNSELVNTHLLQGAELYGINGEMDKSAEIYAKIAKELGKDNSTKSISYYKKCKQFTCVTVINMFSYPILL
jgi:tetratricopeptide (TPR) repeat protein